MSITRGHRVILTAATGLLFGLSAALSHAANENSQGDNGQHKGWYKDDNNRGGNKNPGPQKTVSVPEPETLVLILTGLAAAVVLGRRRQKNQRPPNP